MRDIFFRTPFATSGDVTPVPVAVSPSGTISFTQGWGPDYQRDLASDPLAKPVARQDMNYLFNQVTSVLGRWQAETIPEWIAPADNGGVAMVYAAGMQVRYRASDIDPFVSYVSIVDGNNTTPAPGANWVATSLGVTSPRFTKTKAAATTEFVQDAAGSIRKYVVVSASRSLVSDDVGAALFCPSPSVVVTLPTPLSLGIPSNSGKCVKFFGLDNAFTIVPDSGVTLNVATSTPISSMAVKLGQFLTLLATSDNIWQVVDSTAEMQRNADFSNNLVSSGYQKLPGGFIMQWGAANAQVSGGNVTFGIAFPNQCLCVVLSVANGNSPAMVSSDIPVTTGFTAYSSTGTVSCSFIAIGR